MMVRPARALALLLAIVASAGCGAPESSLPTLTASQQDVEFVVKARGELVASESLPIALPASIRMSFNIAWMAPEFSDIRKGDVIARFDDVQVRLDRETTALSIAKSEYKLVDTVRDSRLERTRIDHEALRVEGEREITETFANADELLLSRNEIIDALADVEYLDVEAGFLGWQFETLDQRTEAEKNLIRAEQQGEVAKLQKQDTALAMMELKSPADGTFVYAETPWGEKLGKGKTVYPGMPIGLLPVRGKVAARLYVPEGDAVGLAPDQQVRLRLDADPDRLFTARVTSVSPVASPRNRDDPQKFFQVEAAIDQVDAELMRVGSQLRAEIVTGAVSGGIVLPAQVVYGSDDDAWVYLARGGATEQRQVQLGARSPNLVEVTGGVQPGDRVSLAAPVDRP
jgi:hypothetical protein